MDLIGFGWSPMHEAVLSLPAVVYPKRTPMHLPWARRCRELPAELLDEIRLLAGTFDGFVPGFFEAGLAGDDPTFEAELDALRRVDPTLVAYEMSLSLGGFGCGPKDGHHGPHLVEDGSYRAEVLASADATGPDAALLGRQIFEDPAAVTERLASMLRHYWELAFAEEWSRILPRIERDVTAGARALVTGGVPALISELLPEAAWDPAASAMTVEKTWETDSDVGERGGLTIVPTSFGWPRVLIETGRPWPLAIFVPLQDMRRPEVPRASDHEVADGLRALGEETRLQIARMVAEQPRSTTELAELLRLSDSAVSRHLKILQSAGVVDGRRDGYFVLYTLQPDRVEQLSRALGHTLGIATASTGVVEPLPVRVAQRR
ncbi:ArsR/SmtB family transcription factor [Euzebya tangerina]|uniref:ArsR/SmtB family transcription factor n=1 Tax=Euzebya tangerina TaxID=591198 RepID=UPI0013C34A41|nr:DUF5937 family protein [Euzebya tangerina]